MGEIPSKELAQAFDLAGEIQPLAAGAVREAMGGRTAWRVFNFLSSASIFCAAPKAGRGNQGRTARMAERSKDQPLADCRA